MWKAKLFYMMRCDDGDDKSTTFSLSAVTSSCRIHLLHQAREYQHNDFINIIYGFSSMPLFQENGLERCQVPMMPQGQPLEGGPSLQGHRPGPHGLHCALHYDGWSLQDNNSHQPSGPGEGTPWTEHSPGLRILSRLARTSPQGTAAMCEHTARSLSAEMDLQLYGQVRAAE